MAVVTETELDPHLAGRAQEPGRGIRGSEPLAVPCSVHVQNAPVSSSNFKCRDGRIAQARTFDRLGLTVPARETEPEHEKPVPSEGELAFVSAIFTFLHESQIGFEQFFFDWYGGKLSADRAQRSPEAEKYSTASFTEVLAGFDQHESADSVDLASTYFAGERPCSLLIDEIEALWDKIVFQRLAAVGSQPGDS